MTPQEQAKELVEKFILKQRETLAYGYNELAKQCALIHVNGIIDMLIIFSGYYYGIEDELNFYIDVRDEITKL